MWHRATGAVYFIVRLQRVMFRSQAGDDTVTISALMYCGRTGNVITELYLTEVQLPESIDWGSAIGTDRHNLQAGNLKVEKDRIP